jgi:hypothetical protein
MTKTDHLARAKKHIADGEASYRKAVDEIRAAMDEDPTLGYRRIGERLGRSEHWCRKLVQHYTNATDPSHPPFGGERENEARYERHVKQILRDPEKRKQAIAELSHDERAELVNEVAKAPAPPTTDKSREALRDHMQDAVAVDLTAQVAKLIAGASRIDLLLAEHGAEFRRINSEQAARLDSDLERVMNTIRDVRGELLKHREIEVAS